MRSIATQFLALAAILGIALPAPGKEDNPKKATTPVPIPTTTDPAPAIPALRQAPVPAPATPFPTPAISAPTEGYRQLNPRFSSPVAPHAPTLNLQEMDQHQQNRIMQRELNKLWEQKEQLRHELAKALERLEAQQTRNLPPLENGTLHAYRLQHIDPTLLAETLESFLGTNQLRLVPDVENNILLTYSSEEVSKQISDLVKVLDAENESSKLGIVTSQSTEKTQSLQVRIFWLADGFGDTAPDDYLPESVIEAVYKLGLKDPLLVTQSATSVAGKPGGDSNFRFNFPATIGYQTLQFESDSDMFFEDQPYLAIHLSINSGNSHIELAGEYSAPLGHYMVLGTTNFATDALNSKRSHSVGGGGGGGGFGFGGGDGFGGGEGRGAVAEEKDDAKPTNNPTTSRFAFVVQVVEAESFAPQE